MLAFLDSTGSICLEPSERIFFLCGDEIKILSIIPGWASKYNERKRLFISKL
jgi:hypothetical protein